MKIQANTPVYQPKKAVSAQATTDGAAPVTTQSTAQTAQPVVAQSVFSCITDFFKNAWTSVVDFFKGLFGM